MRLLAVVTILLVLAVQLASPAAATWTYTYVGSTQRFLSDENRCYLNDQQRQVHAGAQRYNVGGACLPAFGGTTVRITVRDASRLPIHVTYKFLAVPGGGTFCGETTIDVPTGAGLIMLTFDTLGPSCGGVTGVATVGTITMSFA